MKATLQKVVNLSLQTLLISTLFFSCTPDSLIKDETLVTVELQPKVQDTDGDGLINELEILLGTDINNPDTDGDGILDGIEDFNRNGKIDSLESNPLLADTDKDGIPDGLEDANHNGIHDPGEMKATSDDSDNDGIKDAIEDMNHNGKWDVRETDPNNPDTDSDGILDGVEDANGNGRLDPGEMYPLNKDTDGDLVEDGAEDANHNGVKDAGEMDPTKQDTDDDGIPDGLEDKNHNGKKDQHESDATKRDTDGDGINDKDDPDANGDGVADVDEVDDEEEYQEMEYTASVVSTDGYTVEIKITPKEIKPDEKKADKCKWGYKYKIELEYKVEFKGDNKPNKLWTLQGTINNDTEELYFNMNNKGGEKKIKTANAWTDKTNCDTVELGDLGYNEVVVEIDGPGIASQKVTLTAKAKDDNDD